MNDHFTKTGSGRTKVGLGKALKKRDLFFAGVEEGQLITLFNGGIRNSSGARGPEVIATASNASSFGEQHCSPSDAGAPRCHYTFTVLGHWVSAAAAPQWLEWELSLRVRFWEMVLPRFYLYDTNAIICQDRLGTNIICKVMCEKNCFLQPNMGIGRVQALQLPAADGDVHHELLFDGVVVTEPGEWCGKNAFLRKKR